MSTTLPMQIYESSIDTPVFDAHAAAIRDRCRIAGSMNFRQLQ